MLNRRRALMAAQGGSAPILPPEYQRVAYISSDGNAYIDPNITFTNGDLRMKMRAYVSSFGSYGRFLCGQGSGSTMSAWGAALFVNTSGKFTVRSGSNINTIDAAIAKQKFFTVDATLGAGSSQSSSWNIDLDYEGATYSDNGTMQTISYANKLYIARPGSGGFGLDGRIDTAEFWNDGVKVFDGVACYRKSDTKIGMYDYVTQTLFSSAGNKEFTKGADVN